MTGAPVAAHQGAEDDGSAQSGSVAVGPGSEEPERRSLLRTRVPATTAVAAVALVATGMSRPLYQSLTLGALLAVVLIPVWWRSTRSYHDVRTLLLLCGLAVVMGVWLTELASEDHRTPTRMTINGVLVLLEAVLGAAVVVWARTRMRDATVASLFGLGMVLGIDTGGRFAESPWRFGFSIPLTVLLLGLAWMSRRGWLQVVTAFALAGMSAANGGRSMAAMLFLAGVVTLQQSAWRRRGSKAASRVRAVVLVGGLCVALYYLGQAAILDGYLGKDAQERTEEQIALSGSLIAGARPEFGATDALVRYRPYGFGVGTMPSTQDLLVAKAGMAQLRYNPDNGYVERYMFGNGIELHSTAADLWARFGLAGLVLALYALWIVVRGYTLAFSRHAASALLTYLAIRSLWDVLFSPLSSSVVLFALAVGLLAVRRTPPTARP
ncbi:hypothetical protein [Cellulomonas sp. URHB0016]